jgi:hypothetical protein
VTPAEFKAFWQSCSDDQKLFYKREVGQVLGL